MNDYHLQEMLTQADERFARAASPTPDRVRSSFVETVRRRHASQQRRRRGVGVFAAFVVIGLSVWSLSAGRWRRTHHALDTIASNADSQITEANPTASIDGSALTTGVGGQRPLRPEEIARLQTEIAALDAEANRARRLVAIYREGESRRQRLAALQAAAAEPLISPESLAELEINRAAAITVTSADAQANQFNRTAEAADSYRSVITHFPSSRWAGIARQRLTALEQMN
jgi:hypothetical protein